MATFTVTYANGVEKQLTADRYQADGAWLVFKTRGTGDVRISADDIKSVVGPPLNVLSPVVRWTGIAALSVVAVFGIAIGVTDVFGAEFQSGRVLGGLVALAGIVCAFGAHGLVVGSEAGGHRGLFGALVAIVVSAFFLYGLVDGGRGLSLWVVVALAVLVAATVIVLPLAYRSMPGLPAAATALAALGLFIGLFQFWFDKDYVPATEDPGLTELIGLTSGPVPAGKTHPEYVVVKVTLKNVSGTKVRMMGSHFNLWNYEPGTEKETFVESGRLGIPTGNWLVPDQESTEQFVIRLPDEPLPVLRVDLRVHVTKGDRLLHGRRLCKRDENDRCERSVEFRDEPLSWKIGEGSLINRLVRGPRYLVVDREPPDRAIPGPSGPEFPLTEMVTCISRHPICPEQFDAKLNAVYGHVAIGASAHLVLNVR